MFNQWLSIPVSVEFEECLQCMSPSQTTMCAMLYIFDSSFPVRMDVVSATRDDLYEDSLLHSCKEIKSSDHPAMSKSASLEINQVWVKGFGFKKMD